MSTDLTALTNNTIDYWVVYMFVPDTSLCYTPKSELDISNNLRETNILQWKMSIEVISKCQVT